MQYLKTLSLITLTSLLFSCGSGDGSGGGLPTPLTAPTVAVETVGNGLSVHLSWHQISGVDTYNIYYAEQTLANIDLSNYGSLTGGVLIPNLTGTSKEITLINGITYYFVVTALKEGKQLGVSNEVKATPKRLMRALNDTGITWGGKYPGNNADCTGTVITAQDCQHGRDAQAAANTLVKIGGGSAGFDFSKLDNDGNTLLASATDWRCVKDNHTGLIWEMKSTSGLHNKEGKYTWYNTDNKTNGGKVGVANSATNANSCYGYNSSDSQSFCNTQAFVKRINATGLCGGNDWRVPTRGELHSIVDNGRIDPSIDTDYFPNTPNKSFWSSSPDALTPDFVWIIYFNYGEDYNVEHSDNHRLRLVRSD